MPWVTIGPYDEYETFVDDEDVHLLEEKYYYFDGRYIKNKKHGKRNGPNLPRDPSVISYLHRDIMLPEDGLHVDHIDGNVFNNSRSNLRCCSQSDNNKNVDGYNIWDRTKSRPYTNLPFGARLTHNYRSVYVGAFATEEEALEAIKLKKIELRGEFARTE